MFERPVGVRDDPDYAPMTVSVGGGHGTPCPLVWFERPVGVRDDPDYGRFPLAPSRLWPVRDRPLPGSIETFNDVLRSVD